ncbi:hypothetical protein [Streptomyces sp. NPDC007856]|uniref:hypothetical protein n=1 Tax=Streptomyces sp. NPDC007856 TaxID=3364781 RepID=UPI0036A66E5A
MHNIDTARLQIYSVEERTTTTAVCVVRCVGGIARTGQQFSSSAVVDANVHEGYMRLDWILRYEKPADFLEPPHNAKVHLSGKGIDELKRRVILISHQISAPARPDRLPPGTR